MYVPVKELQAPIEQRLRSILAEVPFADLNEWQEEVPLGPGQADAVLQLRTPGEGSWKLILELKGSGEPRVIRSAIQQLQSWLTRLPNTYGVIAVPYISPRAGEICKEAGMGFIDLAGNCRLAFGQIFIERKGLPNPRADSRPLRTLFAPKASRVLRMLLLNLRSYWQLNELASQARVSLGLAFKVKQRLLDLEYAREEGKAIKLIDPQRLLNDWAAAYSYKRSKSLDCYGSGNPSELERAFATYCEENNINYALALFSGASRVAPFVRYQRGFAYSDSDPQKLASALGWKVVPSGANFTILIPFDEGLMYGLQKVDGDRVVSDIQLYLDLSSYGRRGGEAAGVILEQRIRPKW